MPQTNPPVPIPITGAEAAALFADLTHYALIALAVSGGPDSLALLHLAARWRALIPNPPEILVLTIDHVLRSNSAAEAQFVAAQASTVGLPHETLIWSGPKPDTGLANAARDARYQLLTDRLARETASSVALVTAHTLDDQAETFLMRLARGSSLQGLAAMSRERALSSDRAITLVRPFLAVPKARLEATLRALGLTWVTDPTNEDQAYERPRLRKSEPIRASAGLTNEALALTASRLSRANDALASATRALDAASVTHDRGLTASIDRVAFDAAPLELRIRLLERLLNIYGGSHLPARLSEIERLAGRLSISAPAPPAMTTLGGCLINPAGHAIMIGREPGRSGLPILALEPGQTATWDTRFHVTLMNGAPGPCTVRALSAREWTDLKATLCLPAIPALKALSLPAFWHQQRLVALPHLGPLSAFPVLERELHALATAHLRAGFEPFCVARALAPPQD